MSKDKKLDTCNLSEITLDGVAFVRKDSLPSPPTGNRAVVVMDRGWIMAGDVEYRDGRIYLTRVVHVRGWDSIGFDGMIDNPKSEKVKLRKLKDCDMPMECELFKVPVDDSWGL